MRNREQYPSDWMKRGPEMRAKVGNRCQECGVVHGTPKASRWTGRIWPVYLQRHHINGDKGNPDAIVLIVCPSCHWKKHKKKPSWYIEKLKHKKLIDRAYCL